MTSHDPAKPLQSLIETERFSRVDDPAAGLAWRDVAAETSKALGARPRLLWMTHAKFLAWV
jgi:hypothetical protein